MTSVKFYIDIYRRIKSRRLKAAAFAFLKVLGMRYLVIRLDTNNMCNLRCRMCYYSTLTHREPVFMDMKLFYKIANDLFWRTKLLYLSCLTEPLMNKNFSSYLDYVGRYKVPFTSFSTNGMLLSEDVVESCVANNISEIIFSVDGSTATTYEYIRRGASWQKLMEKLEMIRQIKAKTGSELPAVRFNFALMDCNIDELPGLVDIAMAYNVKTIRLRHLLPFEDKQTGLNFQQEIKYIDKYNRLVDDTERKCLKTGVELIRPPKIEKSVEQDISEKPRENLLCVLPWFHFHIKWMGDIRTCSGSPTLGNMGDSSFDEIYNSTAMRCIRRDMLKRSPSSCIWNCRVCVDDPSN